MIYSLFVSVLVSEINFNEKIDLITTIIAVDFMKQSQEGYVCLFTIKNPSYPDYRSK